MRHLIANIATYSIALLLILGAAIFAWARSEQLTLSTERVTLQQFGPAPGNEFRWQELGGPVYERNCKNCHGAEGEGWDQYPGVGHTAALFAAPGGRDYLVDLHLYGLTSERWRAPMPPMAHLQDAALAAVLNHVLTEYGNRERLPEGVRPYTPAEVAARRGQALSPGEVNRQRPGIAR